MAEFIGASSHFMGFDFWATPSWQMVPVGGIRFVVLRDAVGLAVNKTNPAIALEEIGPEQLPHDLCTDIVPTDRAFRLHGLHAGSTEVRATRNGTLVTELKVSVRDPIVVLVSFHFVRDSAGHHTNRGLAAVSDWVDVMNHIYKLQANVEVRSRLVRWIEVPGDLGPCIRTVAHRRPSPTDASLRVFAQRDPGARFNVFMVWQFEAVDTTFDDAGLANSNCLFEDNTSPRVGISLAHEMGHCFTLRDHYVAARRHELMFGYEGQGGRFLPRADIEKIRTVVEAA